MQAAMQLFPLRYRGELQLVQFVAIPEQVLHRELHVVQALLFDMSTYWFEFEQRQLVPLKIKGELQLVHESALSEHVLHDLSQVLQILWSDVSPNSFEFEHVALHVAVLKIPHKGVGHVSTQVPDKN